MTNYNPVTFSIAADILRKIPHDHAGKSYPYLTPLETLASYYEFDYYQDINCKRCQILRDIHDKDPEVFLVLKNYSRMTE